MQSRRSLKHIYSWILNHRNALLFFMVAFAESAQLAFLALEHRIPAGHDTLQEFTLKYYFLNSAVTAGTIPQWLPFMTHGTVANWWYFVQGGLIQNILLLLASPFRNINFLYIYYAELFFDELVLLIGVWLLGGRAFKTTYATLFTSISVIGSTIWYQQIWFNFHAYYAIPLIIYLLHQFLDTTCWRYLFLSALLFTTQWIGNLPYSLSITALVILTYYLAYFAANGISAKKLNLSPTRVTLLIVTVLSGLLIPYLILNHGTGLISNFNPGRLSDNSTSFHTFLTFGNHLVANPWSEFIYRAPLGQDYTIYFGYVAFALSLLGWMQIANKKIFPFALTAIVLILFSQGIPIVLMKVLYEYFPAMKYYRHISLVLPIAKIFLCFVAGFGLDRIASTDSFPKLARKMLMAVALIGICLSIWLWTLNKITPISTMIADFFNIGLTFYDFINDKSLAAIREQSALWLASSAIVILTISLIRRARILGFVLIFALTFQGIELYVYKFNLANRDTRSLSDQQYVLNKFIPVPYEFKRGDSILGKGESYRVKMLLPIFTENNLSNYWSTESYLFADELTSAFHVDHFLRPLDNFMKAFWGQPVNSPQIIPEGLRVFKNIPNSELTSQIHNPNPNWRRYLIFPHEYLTALKFAGYTEDKIQFFSTAYLFDDEQRIADLIGNPQFSGNQLILQGKHQSAKQCLVMPNTRTEPSKEELQKDDRVHIQYKVIEFTSNSISIEVESQAFAKSVWLYYSDVWHPFWQATINGKSAQVMQANLAYKAVCIDPGSSIVRFNFNSRLIELSYIVTAIISAISVAAILILIWKKIIKVKATPNSEK